MNKAELLQDLEDRVVRVITVIEEDNDVLKAQNVTPYIANVLNLEGDSARGQNVGFYVVDEGTADEKAYYRDGTNAGSTKTQQAEALQFLAQLPFIRVRILEQRPDSDYAIVQAYKENDDGTASRIEVIIYHDADGNPAFKELT